MSSGRGCPAFMRDFPGAVLAVSPEGAIVVSNGRLEAELEREVIGRTFSGLLDLPSSGRKWERMLADARVGGGVAGELILCNEDQPMEPRAFSVLREPDAELLWLVEHPRDPRLERMSEAVTEVNSELARAQRELSKERARLARTLDELRRRQEELERVNSELDQFAHVVSHDLKAPLRSITSYSRWLEEDLGDRLTETAREHLDLLRQRVAYMEAMIAGILQYARAGRGGSAAERVDVGELVSEVVQLLHAPPHFQVEMEPGLPVLEGHRVQLEQVFLNLIGNAVKYAGGADPRVRIGAADAGEFHEFFVADNGPGIAPRLQERIWTMFFTGRPANEADSTGIGLSVVRKLVESQGGRAWVEPGTGVGATFRFLWPKAPPEP